MIIYICTTYISMLSNITNNNYEYRIDIYFLIQLIVSSPLSKTPAKTLPSLSGILFRFLNYFLMSISLYIFDVSMVYLND